MKLWRLIICLAALASAGSAMAQDGASFWGTQSSSTTSYGPGVPLPDNSKPSTVSDPGVLFSKATDFANQLKTQTMDFIGLLWLVSLLYAAWNAQIRGFQELIEPFLRVMFALVLLDNYTDLAAALMDAVQQLGSSLPPQTLGNLGGLASIGISGGLVGMMTGGVSFVALGVGVAIASLFIFVALGMQILLKACLIALGPLAIACITFRHTSGIFTAWLKTFIALCLIPLGWKIGAGLAGAMMFPKSLSLGDVGPSLGSVLAVLPMAVGVYFGMPTITLWVVNKASGIAGTAFPSPIQQAANFLGSAGKGAGGAASKAIQVTEQLGTNAAGSAVSASYTVGGDNLYSKILGGMGGSNPMTTAMRSRILAATNIHQQHQQKA